MKYCKDCRYSEFVKQCIREKLKTEPTDVIIEMQQTIDQLRQRAEAAEKERDMNRRALDALADAITDKMPADARIKKLAGFSFVDSIKDYEFVPKGTVQFLHEIRKFCRNQHECNWFPNKKIECDCLGCRTKREILKLTA